MNELLFQNSPATAMSDEAMIGLDIGPDGLMFDFNMCQEVMVFDL